MPDIPAGPETTATIAVGETISNVLEVAGDHDWIAIELTEGQAVLIALGGTGTDPVYDTYLYIRDSAGLLLGSNDDSGPGYDSELRFVAPATGTYYIDVGAYNDRYDGEYSLTVQTFAAIVSTGTVDSVYGFNSTPDTASYDPVTDSGTRTSVIDGGGNDTFDFSGFSDRQTINLNSGSSSSVAGGTNNLLIEWGTVIENAVGGSGGDTLIGNYGDNMLDGGAGADRMEGLSGDDTYHVDSTGDRIVEYYYGGVDTVRSSINFRLPDYVENLVLTGSARAGIGNSGANTLVGNSADNELNGGGGSDIMIGRDGDDLYMVNSVNDLVVEAAGEGWDTVYSSINLTLAGEVEALFLRGSAVNATGNALDNKLVGNSLDNMIDGSGGADVMYGQGGNDTYHADDAADRAVEDEDGGIDVVVARATFHLGAYVENLTLAGSGNINAYGNWLDNVLVGNDGANILEGGLGADDATGGGGADTFLFRDGAFDGLTGSTSDRITDFDSGDGDRISLYLVDADTTVSGRQNFDFIGNAEFSGTAGELRYGQGSGGNTIISGDLDGDGVADFVIRLDGQHTLTVGDFVL